MKFRILITAAAILLLALLLCACDGARQNEKTPTGGVLYTEETAAMPDSASAPTGVSDGTASETKTPSSGADPTPSSTDAETIEEEPLYDDFDALDHGESVELTDGGLYMGGIREIDKKDIVFSVSSYELQRLLWREPGDYVCRILFTQKASVDLEEHVFPSVVTTLSVPSWGYVDMPLKNAKFDCGFCPTAGRNYTVEIAVTERGDPLRVICEKTFECRANVRLQLSAYYHPTSSEGKSVTRAYVLTYRAQRNGSVEGALSQHLTAGAQASTVKAVPAEGYRFKNWSDGSTDPERADRADKSAVFTAFFERVDKVHLANVYLTTLGGQPISNRDYEVAHMKIENEDAPAYNLDTDLEIKLRGNSSVGSTHDSERYDSKNSYSIKLFEKTKLLGVGNGKSRKWVLNANKFDLSGLRNYIVWTFARAMGTIPFVPQCTWVHLYVNGDYRGLYMLSEKANVEKGRVEVDDSATGDPDKGYLIELDFRGQSSGDPWFDIEGYGPDPAVSRYDAVEFVIKSDIEGDADLLFIKDYVNRCHKAIMSGDREEIEKLIDLASLVDMYILEELSKDCDSGRASFYICKDKGGKLFFTCPWDFDFGFGTYEQATVIPGRVSHDDECCTWFASLIRRKWFADLIHERLQELEPKLEKVLEALRNTSELIGDDIDRNAERWDMYGNNFHVYVSSLVSGDLNDLEEHITFLEKWIRQRYKWLEEN